MFSQPQKQLSSNIPLVVDVSGRGIRDVSQIPGGGREVAALTADNNKLTSLNGIHAFTSLIQCSVCSNNLVHIGGVSSLTRLVTLNLQNNSITVIEGLETLTQLEWLGLAGNSIKAMNGLSGNTKLAHLDLSDNCITELDDISMLSNLKTLLLHGNVVKSLKSIPGYFPPSLTTLSLAENHVQDLNEVSFLSVLPQLSEVSMMGNPCVSLTHHSTLFDYRPYVVYWCPRISTLDGIPITAEEKLRSVSLFHSDHTYPFRLGQHQLLVQYLTTACPLPVLQNQMYSSSSEQSMTLEPSSHALLTQAMTLENPQHKADIMQKLRVLQVLEQMISQQENLMNTQQHSPKPQSQTSIDINSINVTEDKENLEKCYESQKSLLPLSYTMSDDMNSSMTDTLTSGGMCERYEGSTHTNISGDVGDDVRCEGSEGDITRPQPSLPFNIVDGSTNIGHKIAWVKEMAVANQKESVYCEDREGKLGRGDVEGREEEELMKVETIEDEPDFSTVLSVSSSQSSLTLLHHSLPSIIDNDTHATTALSVTDTATAITPSPTTAATTALSVTETLHTIPVPSATSRYAGALSATVTNESSTPSITTATTTEVHIPGTSSLSTSHNEDTTLTDMNSVTEGSPLYSSRVDPYLINDEQTRGSSQSSNTLESHTPFPTVPRNRNETGSVQEWEESVILGKEVVDWSHETASTTTQSDTLTSSQTVTLSSTCTTTHTSSRSQHRAAVMIQAMVRGFLCRRRVCVYRTRHHAAITIQSSWRGFRSRKSDPVVINVRRELSRKKMECYITTMYLQLKGCREEMAHHAQVLQLQEETIASLIQEVDSLHTWRREMEAKLSRKAAITIQRYWRGYRARKKACKMFTPSQQRLELQSLYHHLKQQVKALKDQMVTLQHDHINRKMIIDTSGSIDDVTLPAPGKLTMSKYSPDTILLQWEEEAVHVSPDGETVDHSSNCSSLVGYRVYVNGTEEGIVGPTKHRAYIEGLDPASTYRILVRAVYECGESGDSNILLVASLNPGTHEEGELSASTPDDDLDNGGGGMVVSLPRSSNPPSPTQPPLLVGKTSTLSRSESCSTLGAISVENSTTVEARSISFDQLGVGKPEHPFSDDKTVLQQLQSVSQAPTNDHHSFGMKVGQTDTITHHHTATQRHMSQISGTSNVDPISKETSTDVDQIMQQMSTSVDPINISYGVFNTPTHLPEQSEHTHNRSSGISSLTQEIVNELSMRYSQANTTHSLLQSYDCATSSMLPPDDPTTKEATRPCAESLKLQGLSAGGAADLLQEKACVKGLSNFPEKELASLLRKPGEFEALGCVQTQWPPPVSTHEIVLKTDTPAPHAHTVVTKNSHSSSIPATDGVVTVCTALKTKPVQTIPTYSCSEGKRSPVSRRSPRLAANFECVLRTGHPSTNMSTTTSGMTFHVPQTELGMKPHNLVPHTATLSLPELQTNFTANVSPTQPLCSNKCTTSVGETQIVRTSEIHPEQINLSRDSVDQKDKVLAGDYDNTRPVSMMTRGSQKHPKGGMHSGMFGSNQQQELLATTSNLSTKPHTAPTQQNMSAATTTATQIHTPSQPIDIPHNDENSANYNLSPSHSTQL